MNEIEQRFYNSFLFYKEECNLELPYKKIVEIFEVLPSGEIESQVVIGPYKVDFVYDRCVIEIDGHDNHKTKEQRDYDYKRERYLQKQGYIVVRFTGTEVFLNSRSCVREMIRINNVFERKDIENYEHGFRDKYRDE